MLSVQDFLRMSSNSYATVAEEKVCGDVDGFIDTGSYTFNAIVSGSLFNGIPNNKIVSLIGEESVGKTFFVLSTAKNFLEQNKNALVFYFETEGALTTDTLKNRNIDLKRLLIFPVTTVQEFKNQCLKLISAYENQKEKQPVLIVLDSLGNLSTTKEMEDSLAGAETKDMTRAQIIKAAFRVLSLKLSSVKIPMLITNHVYDMIGLYAGKQQSGGKGSRYAASITINLSKSKEKEGDEQTGSIITCTVVKSRFTKEGLRVKCLIRFNGGLDKYYGLLDIADKYGIFKKISTRYETPQGKAFGKTIENNPSKYFTTDILAEIEKHINKDYKFITQEIFGDELTIENNEEMEIE